MQVQSQRVHEYPTWFRQRVLSSPGSTSALAARWQVSPRSIRRWRQQQRETGSIAPRRRSPGRPSRYGLRELILLAVFKVLFPDALLRDCAWFLQQFGISIQISETWLISRALYVMGFTKKKLTHISERRNPDQRRLWWECPPPVGVKGVPTGLLIDIDESGVFLCSTLRTFGHAPVGHRARVVVPPPRGVKYTLMLAISPSLGVVASLVLTENTSTLTFKLFLESRLLPALTGRGFYIMMDNLPVHRTTAVKEVIQAAGHMQLFRPAYSPDLAPIECAFSKIKTHLRSRRYDINEDNLLHFIEEAIRSITVEDCKNWFKNCGYSS